MTIKTRRRYTDEFKAEAVRLVRDSARPVAQVARDLGIADPLLYHWRVEQRQAESQGHTRESRRTEQEELMRLSDEIPGDPGARPSLSHALDVPLSANRATHRVGEHRVARLMRHDALRAKTAKQWQATTHSSHCLPVVASALDMPSPFSELRFVRTEV